MDADLENVAAWCFSDSLLINPDRIKFLLFGSSLSESGRTIYTISRRRANTRSLRKRLGRNARFLLDV
jgi:hypothetical protein